MLKADLHIHTCYSPDSDSQLEDIIKRCQKLGINCIAIADHGTTKGASKMKELAPFKVIVAEEILTTRGEIMGMFLNETIPSGLSPEETVERIRAQNGLVCVPHPVDILRSSALAIDTFKELASQGKIDLAEALNARTILKICITKSRRLIDEYKIKATASSDAHTIDEIGRAYLEIPEFKGREDFLAAVAAGRICGKRNTPLVHLSSLKERLFGKKDMEIDNDKCIR